MSPISTAIPIGLVRIGTLPELNIRGIAHKLNQLQKVFDFHVIEESIEILSGYPDGAHNHPDSVFFDALKTKKSVGYTYIVGLTRQRLDRNSFNRHDAPNAVGLVTVDGWESFRPPHVTIDKYVSYLILCEVFCIISGKQLEHRERYFCLFDYCNEKNDLITCLKMPRICSEKCQDELVRSGFTSQHINAAAKILEYVGDRSFWYSVQISGNNFIVGAIVGALLTGMLTNKLSALTDGQQWGVIGILLLLFLLCVSYNQRKNS